MYMGSAEDHVFADTCKSFTCKPTKLVWVSGIPKNYHAYNLRAFFSQFVESSRFLCFHYRHRPDLNELENTEEVDGLQIFGCIKRKNRSKVTCCAILSILGEHADELFRLYNRLNWLDEKDDMPLDLKCTLRPINGTVEEFNHLPEFRPLSWMPRGNVGTPTQHFFNLVKECKLQSSIISKLHLDFAIRAKIRKYGAVPFIYDDSSVNSAQPNSSPDLQTDRPNCNVTRRSVSIKHNPSFKDTFGHISSVDFDDGDDDIPEEWDRFEALHDDPYNLDRGNKAQLKYESKVELVWEKGGSGLVFHTDQRTWEKLDPLRKEEIFDEPSSFDWDIDMQPYEAPTAIGSGPTPNGFTGAERDTAELIDINREKESMDVQDLAYNVYAAFSNEVITKGYGGRILERMGWTPGTALSVKSSHSKVTSGLIDPITCEGSLPPKVRTGLGYYGPRILRNSCKKMLNPGSTFINKEQKLKSVYIRSVFDSPQTVARRSGLGLFPSLLRRNDPGLVVKWLSDKKVSSTSPTESTVPLDERILIKNRTIILNSYGNLSKEGISFVSGGYLNPS